MAENQKESKGGRKPKYDYQSEEFLSLVESYAKKGFTDKERSRKTRLLHIQSLRYMMVAEPSLRCLERSKVVLVPDALKKLIYDITFAVLEDFSGSYQI
ncbi:MAG: hypothetical protein K2L31_05880 [Muribaculum sp.]|nr:hypothetical protein [Muribaculum sp.]